MRAVIDMRELSGDEVDKVNGALAANGLGAIIGGVSSAAGAAFAGGSISSVSAAFVGGAVTGFLMPGAAAVNADRNVATSVGKAVATVGKDVGANAAGGAASTRVTG